MSSNQRVICTLCNKALGAGQEIYIDHYPKIIKDDFLIHNTFSHISEETIKEKEPKFLGATVSFPNTN